MKILVIFTGGTIGSQIKDGWISPDNSAKYELIANYRGKAKFDTLSPYTILSEQLSATELNMLTECVFDNLDKGYDGIIVTHGTDTLQYSASVLGLMLGECKIPVVMVSANYPLSDKRSNGHINFKTAVEFIKKKQKGVFVAYKNTNEKHAHIHNAVHILRHAECTDEVYSLENQPYCIGRKVNKKHIPLTDEERQGTGRVLLCEKPEILKIDSIPADSFNYDLSRYKAVLISPYHSGTLNTLSENFKGFCQRAKEKNVEIFVPNVKCGIAYESSKIFCELGLKILPYCTQTKAYMELWINLSKKR